MKINNFFKSVIKNRIYNKIIYFYCLTIILNHTIHAQVWTGSNVSTNTISPVGISITNPNLNSSSHLLVRRNLQLIAPNPYIKQNYIQIESYYAGLPPQIAAVTSPVLTLNDQGYLALGFAEPLSPLQIKVPILFNQKSIHYTTTGSKSSIIDASTGLPIQVHRQLFYVNKLYEANYGLVSRINDHGLFWSDGNNIQTETENVYSETGEIIGQQTVTKYYNTQSGFVLAPWYKPSNNNSDFRGLRMDALGNVSIGYYQTFATNGVPNKLAVNGVITCKEINLDINYAWPDYVFKKKYRLISIDSLEAFIHANKHLPGIPKASVIENQGLQVGEMQKNMMEKIEELSLYIIELNKRLLVLEEENKKLKCGK